MERFTQELGTLYFWVTVVGLSLALNVVASYLTRSIDWTARWASFRRKVATDRARAKHVRRVLWLARREHMVVYRLNVSSQAHTMGVTMFCTAIILWVLIQLQYRSAGLVTSVGVLIMSAAFGLVGSFLMSIGDKGSLECRHALTAVNNSRRRRNKIFSRESA